MGGKIDLFFDCVSPYSWFALHYLLKNRKSLESYGVHFELFPVFLGGIMNKSGNKPPWTFQRKAVQGQFDRVRAEKYFDLRLNLPKNFPIFTLLVCWAIYWQPSNKGSPQGGLTYIKSAYPPYILELATTEAYRSVWQFQEDISKPEIMRTCLLRVFQAEEVDEVMEAANSPTVKEKLLETTDQALEAGAYGCPWFIVTNSEGVKEPFFGSDRFHYMWEFLGIPFRDVEIVEKEKL